MRSHNSGGTQSNDWGLIATTYMIYIVYRSLGKLFIAHRSLQRQVPIVSIAEKNYYWSFRIDVGIGSATFHIP